MIEILKHLLGLCGEQSHPNLITILLGGFFSKSIFSYIKLKIKSYLTNLNKIKWGKSTII
jgi:hypothetical protein